jgi:broad specificity phosphatase PhoE
VPNPAATWPSILQLVRHGESAGNVARDDAMRRRLAVIDIGPRDMDVELSERGRDQAQALGPWLGPQGGRADVVLASPYARAEQTARLATDGWDVPVHLDERLREREFGILDRLTRRGIEERFPDQAAARGRLGKFYHRPPGGESWCDVAARVRSVLDTISRQHAGRHVVVFSHEVVILMFCYVLQHLREPEVLALARERPLANCSVTTFRAEPGAIDMELVDFGATTAVETSPAHATNEPPHVPSDAL